MYIGASFRNLDEIVSLAGCDRLTIAPALLEELRSTEGEVKQVRRRHTQSAKA
jgi:transaldolase